MTAELHVHPVPSRCFLQYSGCLCGPTTTRSTLTAGQKGPVRFSDDRCGGTSDRAIKRPLRQLGSMGASEDDAAAGGAIRQAAGAAPVAATAVPPAAAPPRQPQATVLPSHAGPATLLVPDATTGSPVQHLGDIGGKDVGISGLHLVDRGAATPAAVEQPPQQQLQEQEQEHHQQQPPSSSAGGRQALLEESNVRGSLEAEVAATLRALPDHAQAGALPPPQLATARASPHCTGH